jgi:hypothetical protein
MRRAESATAAGFFTFCLGIRLLTPASIIYKKMRFGNTFLLTTFVVRVYSIGSMMVIESSQHVTGLQDVEPEPLPFCLSCGSLRLDWTGAGWKCQDCGVVEEVFNA